MKATSIRAFPGLMSLLNEAKSTDAKKRPSTEKFQIRSKKLKIEDAESDEEEEEDDKNEQIQNNISNVKLEQFDDSDSDSEVNRTKQRKVGKARYKKPKKPLAVIQPRKQLPVEHVDETKMINVVNMLDQETLNKDLLDDLCKYYDISDQHWTNKELVDLPLYARDEEERQRQSLLQKGMFNSPFVFSLIRHMCEKSNSSTGSLSDMKNNMINMYHIEAIPREWDEKYLCSPDPNKNERGCVNGQSCLCMDLFGFQMKEFLTPRQVASGQFNYTAGSSADPSFASHRKDNNPLTEMCLLCARKNMSYLRTMLQVCDVPPSNVINQKWKNLISIPNEYCISDCLTLGNGIIYPVIMNKYKGYTMIRGDNGQFRLTQSGYKLCTQADIAQLDFRAGTLPQKKADEDQHRSNANL